MGIFFKNKKNQGGSQNLHQKLKSTVFTKTSKPPNIGFLFPKRLVG
jgi:hypothetical protein